MIIFEFLGNFMLTWLLKSPFTLPFHVTPVCPPNHTDYESITFVLERRVTSPPRQEVNLEGSAADIYNMLIRPRLPPGRFAL